MSEKLDDRYEDLQNSHDLLPLREKPGMIPLQREKKNVEFRVYCRDTVNRSMILLGMVIERRAKERGNNLKDLLVKAKKDYSNCAVDPSTIFLLSS